MYSIVGKVLKQKNHRSILIGKISLGYFLRKYLCLPMYVHVCEGTYPSIFHFQKCFDTGKTYTYNDLQTKVQSMAANLVELGIRQGDVVFLLSPNTPDYAIIYLATISIGAIITTNNPAYTSGECWATFVYSQTLSDRCTCIGALIQ